MEKETQTFTFCSPLLLRVQNILFKDNKSSPRGNVRGTAERAEEEVKSALDHVWTPAWTRPRRGTLCELAPHVSWTFLQCVPTSYWLRLSCGIKCNMKDLKHWRGIITGLFSSFSTGIYFSFHKQSLSPTDTKSTHRRLKF